MPPSDSSSQSPLSERSRLIVHIQFPADNCTIGELEVTPLSTNRYRLEDSPLFAESATIYDVIEAERVDQETLRFIRVAEKSNWKTYTFCVAENIAESEELKVALANVEQYGARWDRVFGGLVYIFVSPDSDYDPTADINALLD